VRTALRPYFEEFVSKVESRAGMVIDEILSGLTPEEIKGREQELGVPLPDSYKRFLSAVGGFSLFDGAVQFNRSHPYRDDFPKYESLSEDAKRQVASNGGLWPPPSDGMVCFGEYFEGDVGCSVLFNTNEGRRDGEYPIVYYYYRASPPRVAPIADSFPQWLNRKCIDGLQW
jgi:hypothetical protein